MTRQQLVLGVTIGTAAAGAAACATPKGRARARRLLRSAAQRSRYECGRLRGLAYHLAGHSPDPDAHDELLADRVRSVLGLVQHRLDLPRVHVTATGHDISLHGNVATDVQARRLAETARRVTGVEAVDAHLHVGFPRGTTRPSAGRHHRPPSPMLAALLAAAGGGGASEGSEHRAVGEIVGAFLALLPAGERRHVRAHLPMDVQSLAEPALAAAPRRRPRLHAEFMAAALPTTHPYDRVGIVESVIGALREQIPEESEDVAAVLPPDLRVLWRTAIPL